MNRLVSTIDGRGQYVTDSIDEPSQILEAMRNGQQLNLAVLGMALVFFVSLIVFFTRLNVKQQFESKARLSIQGDYEQQAIPPEISRPGDIQIDDARWHQLDGRGIRNDMDVLRPMVHWYGNIMSILRTIWIYLKLIAWNVIFWSFPTTEGKFYAHTGHCHIQLGNYEKAIDHFRRSLKTSCEPSIQKLLQSALSYCYAQLGHSGESQQYHDSSTPNGGIRRFAEADREEPIKDVLPEGKKDT